MTQNSKRVELVQCIGELHEQLVVSVETEEVLSEYPNLESSRKALQDKVVKELVEAIKQLKLLEPAPCADEQLPAETAILRTPQLLAAVGDCDWIKGFKAALRSYAWWKDGVQYVGSCGTTLEQALAEVDAKYVGQEGGT